MFLFFFLSLSGVCVWVGGGSVLLMDKRWVLEDTRLLLRGTRGNGALGALEVRPDLV